MAVNSNKNHEDVIARYRNTQQSLTERIIENTNKNFRQSCDPHGQVLSKSFIRSNVLEDESIHSPDATKSRSDIFTAANPKALDPRKMSEFEAALYGAEQETFAASWTQVPATDQQESPCLDNIGPKEESISDQRSIVPEALECRQSSETSEPVSGIKRTQRGTIEFVKLPDGRTITPHYNHCGIITMVEFNDGTRIVKSENHVSWIVVDSDGQRINDVDIISLMFDRSGNLMYSTACGERVTLHTDGLISSARCDHQDLNS